MSLKEVSPLWAWARHSPVRSSAEATPATVPAVVRRVSGIMQGGDDVFALVLETSASAVRAGDAGNASPVCSVSVEAADDDAPERSERVQRAWRLAWQRLGRPLREDGEEKTSSEKVAPSIEHGSDDRGATSTHATQPVLMVEPALPWDATTRRALAQFAFYSLDVPGAGVVVGRRRCHRCPGGQRLPAAESTATRAGRGHSMAPWRLQQADRPIARDTVRGGASAFSDAAAARLRCHQRVRCGCAARPVRQHSGHWRRSATHRRWRFGAPPGGRDGRDMSAPVQEPRRRGQHQGRVAPRRVAGLGRWQYLRLAGHFSSAVGDARRVCRRTGHRPGRALPVRGAGVLVPGGSVVVFVKDALTMKDRVSARQRPGRIVFTCLPRQRCQRSHPTSILYTSDAPAQHRVPSSSRGGTNASSTRPTCVQSWATVTRCGMDAAHARPRAFVHIRRHVVDQQHRSGLVAHVRLAAAADRGAAAHHSAASAARSASDVRSPPQSESGHDGRAASRLRPAPAAAPQTPVCGRIRAPAPRPPHRCHPTPARSGNCESRSASNASDTVGCGIGTARARKTPAPRPRPPPAKAVSSTIPTPVLSHPIEPMNGVGVDARRACDELDEGRGARWRMLETALGNAVKRLQCSPNRSQSVKPLIQWADTPREWWYRLAATLRLRSGASTRVLAEHHRTARAFIFTAHPPHRDADGHGRARSLLCGAGQSVHRRGVRGAVFCVRPRVGCGDGGFGGGWDGWEADALGDRSGCRFRRRPSRASPPARGTGQPVRPALFRGPGAGAAGIPGGGRPAAVHAAIAVGGKHHLSRACQCVQRAAVSVDGSAGQAAPEPRQEAILGGHRHTRPGHGARAVRVRGASAAAYPLPAAGRIAGDGRCRADAALRARQAFEKVLAAHTRLAAVPGHLRW
eukprot:ctg_2487.g559